MPTSLDKAERRELRRKTRSATLEAVQSMGGEARRDLIAQRALADGGFTPRELTAQTPEGTPAKYARLVDHDLSWALTDLKRDGLLENPKWGTWRLAGAALETMPTTAPVAKDRLGELRRMSYRDYLRTPEWRRSRAAALLRASNCCSLDVTHSNGLEVHHRTYERIGAELASDLIVLCRSCHQLHHQEYGRPRRDRSVGSQPVRAAHGVGLAENRNAQAHKPRNVSLLRRLLAS